MAGANRLLAGELTRRLQIEQPVTAQNEFGEPTSTWVPFRTLPVRARVRPLSSREYFAAQQAQATSTHEITIRPINGLTSNMRFVDVDTGQIFNVDGPPRTPDRRGAFETICLCQEVE